jgi:hypothetical protein
MKLNEFSVGDVVTNNDGEVFEIKQIFSTGTVKVFVKECEEESYWDAQNNFIKPGKTYTLDCIDTWWELVSPKSSNISNQDFKTMENHIQNLQKELDSAKSSLEKMKKQSIPELIVGEMYEIPLPHKLDSGKIIITYIEDDDVEYVYLNDLDDVMVDNTSSLNDGTLKHLNSTEEKIVAKFLYNNYLKLN